MNEGIHWNFEDDKYLLAIMLKYIFWVKYWQSFESSIKHNHGIHNKILFSRKFIVISWTSHDL